MNNNNNWLGFSLSPQINMEDDHQQASPVSPSSVQNCSSIFLSPSGLCGYDANNAAAAAAAAGLYSQLSAMPVKSDGSLCILEALSRSQNQG